MGPDVNEIIAWIVGTLGSTVVAIGWAADYIAASQLQPGQIVAVRIDANNPSLIYPGVAWAEYTNARVIRLK